MQSFISGALMMGFWVAGLFFLRFFRETRDRLFAIFAVAFGLLALERLVLVLFAPITEERSYVFLIRSVAFLAIISAIVDKNRKGAPSEGRATLRPLARSASSP